MDLDELIEPGTLSIEAFVAEIREKFTYLYRENKNIALAESDANVFLMYYLRNNYTTEIDNATKEEKFEMIRRILTLYCAHVVSVLELDSKEFYCLNYFGNTIDLFEKTNWFVLTADQVRDKKLRLPNTNYIDLVAKHGNKVHEFIQENKEEIIERSKNEEKIPDNVIRYSNIKLPYHINYQYNKRKYERTITTSDNEDMRILFSAIEELENETETALPEKKKRGRPRKYPITVTPPKKPKDKSTQKKIETPTNGTEVPKRKRGRPRKIKPVEEIELEDEQDQSDEEQAKETEKSYDSGSNSAGDKNEEDTVIDEI